MLDRLDLHEGRLTRGIYVPRNVAAALARLNVATLVPTTEQDRYDVSNVRKVGVVVLDGTVVRILPKTPVRRLFALLLYARSPESLWRDDLVSFDSDDDLYSTVAHAFAVTAERSLEGGLLRGYVAREEASPVIRGKWRTTDQVTRRAGHSLPMEVTYDDYVTDIPENQVLKAAALKLLRFPDLTPEVRGSLRRSLRLLDDVTPLPGGLAPPTLASSRANSRYQASLVLADIILSNRSLEHREGSVVGSGFLIDLWTVFEDFVEIALARALERRVGSAKAQLSTSLDCDHHVSIAPDLVWSIDSVIAACVDVKYKVERNGKYPNSDLYQLIAYTTRFGLSTGHLVYAAGDSEPNRVEVVNGPVLYQHALDLSVPFVKLLDQIDDVAVFIGDHVPSIDRRGMRPGADGD
jgi:5-methylcytosine-specific restriction enzyme subunit McrC